MQIRLHGLIKSDKHPLLNTKCLNAISAGNYSADEQEICLYEWWYENPTGICSHSLIVFEKYAHCGTSPCCGITEKYFTL